MAKQVLQEKLPAAAPATSSSTPVLRPRFRISLEGVKVLCRTPNGMPYYVDHLDLEADSAPQAIEQFARLAGLRWRTDSLTGKKIIDSVHAPKVDLIPDVTHG